jgi:hypothetical protein
MATSTASLASDSCHGSLVLHLSFPKTMRSWVASSILEKSQPLSEVFTPEDEVHSHMNCSRLKYFLI